MLELAAAVLDYARGLGVTEVNLGGGMAVSYTDPVARFDWKTYGEGLAALRRPGEVLRIEPGRALTVYCGRYVTRVIDVKRVHGELFAVVAGAPTTSAPPPPRVMTSRWPPGPRRAARAGMASRSRSSASSARRRTCWPGGSRSGWRRATWSSSRWPGPTPGTSPTTTS
nr:hypothetical protein GCM10020093_059510 [Planobispora longispora]